MNGLYDDPAKLARDAATWNQYPDTVAIWVSMNQLDPEKGRAQFLEINTLLAQKVTIDDGDVAKRSFLLIDVDPHRDSNLSSTDAELAAAQERASVISHFLTSKGWPKPRRAHSGNGAHLLYRVDLPADDDVIERCLDALAAYFSNSAVKIDTGVSNASRVVKLAGTKARKGPNTTERPHRYSRLLDVPERLEIVTKEQLDELAQLAPVFERPGKRRGGREFLIEEWLRDHSEIKVWGPEAWISKDGHPGRKWELQVCPFNDAHNRKEAVIIQHEDGSVWAGCQHSGGSCFIEGHKWSFNDLRDKVEPGWRTAPDSYMPNKHDNPAVTIVKQLLAQYQLFRDDDDQTYLDVRDNGERRTIALRDDVFPKWLRRGVFHRTSQTTGDGVLNDVVNQLEAEAYKSDPVAVYLRVGKDDQNNIYVDLGDSGQNVVRISSGGYSLIPYATCPVLFRRTRQARPLPTPVDSGQSPAEEFNQFFSRMPFARDDQIMILMWLLSCLGATEYPVGVLYGRAGNGKSTSVDLLIQLIDPNAVGLRQPPDNTRDVRVAAHDAFLLAYDNLGTINKDTSNALCCLSTGAAIAERALYTNHGEAFFKAKRPILLNSRHEIVEHDDLVTRSLFIDNLAIVNDSTQVRDGERGRRLKSQVYAEFEQQRPFLLGALYTAVAQGLRNKNNVDLSHISRMTEASAFAMAALPTLGVSREEFLRAYELNQVRGQASASERDSVVLDAVFSFMEKQRKAADFPGYWEGTASDLMKRISSGKLALVLKTAAQLTQIMNDNTMTLRAHGLDWRETCRTSNSKIKRLTCTDWEKVEQWTATSLKAPEPDRAGLSRGESSIHSIRSE
jgi:hypothetical protein